MKIILENLNNHSLKYSGSMDNFKINTVARKFGDKLNDLLPIPNRICSVCSNKLTFRNYKFKLSHIESNRYVVMFDTHIGDKVYQYNGETLLLEYSKCNECSLQNKINPNSVKGLRLLYKQLSDWSDDEIKSLIRQRNKSPFYKENYKSEEDYKTYQSHSMVSDAEKKLWHEKRIKTYNENKQSFIEQYGIDSWKNLMKETKDSMSLKFFIEKYGDNKLARLKHEERCQGVAYISPNEYSSIEDKIRHIEINSNIRSKDDFLSHVSNNISDRTICAKYSFILKLFKYQWKSEYYPIMYYCCIDVFNVTIDDFVDYFKIPDEIINGTSKTKLYYNFEDDVKRGISYIIYHDGIFFRSDIEYTFYKSIRDNDNIKIIEINGKYEDIPNSLRYDFKLEINDQIYFIETCGTFIYSSVEYKAKMKLKEDKFNSIVLNYKFFKKFLNDCESGANLYESKYY